MLQLLLPAYQKIQEKITLKDALKAEFSRFLLMRQYFRWATSDHATLYCNLMISLRQHMHKANLFLKTSEYGQKITHSQITDHCTMVIDYSYIIFYNACIIMVACSKMQDEGNTQSIYSSFHLVSKTFLYSISPYTT